VDRPEANDFTVGIMALVAQAEREAISKRTHEVLSVARCRGVRLVNPNGAAVLKRPRKGAQARDGRWHVLTVTNLLARLGLRGAACASRV
jgi:DNA invertase Pin-like site-specific DNA recombinase